MSGGGMNGREGEQSSSYGVKRGGTGDRGEEQPGVRGLHCGVLKACAATEGYVWVHGPTPAWVCVDVCDLCYHQRP